MITFSKYFFKKINVNFFSTVNNVTRYNNLLHEYYTRKINLCPLCHENNKCNANKFYNFNFYNETQVKHITTERHFCVKTRQI